MPLCSAANVYSSSLHPGGGVKIVVSGMCDVTVALLGIVLVALITLLKLLKLLVVAVNEAWEDIEGSH